MTLIGVFPAKANPELDAFLLDCRLADGSGRTVRIDPRLRQVQELDPVTAEVQNTITTVEPPAELGGGIIDDSTEQTSIQRDGGPDIDQRGVNGTCQRIHKLP